MRVVFISRKKGDSYSFSSGTLLAFSALITLSLAVGAYWLGAQQAKAPQPLVNADLIQEWETRLLEQSQTLQSSQQMTESHLDGLRVKLASLQARLTRLDALGERLVDVASLEDGEFDFYDEPGLGGPEGLTVEAAAPDFSHLLDELSQQIDSREQQLSILNTLLGDRETSNATFIAGRPIDRGWMSSRYGYRNDPFTGRRTWHAGVDFAGKEGSNIFAVGSGVVTWAGERYGYGLLVEINHGSGYVTRYAHAAEVLVSIGDVVERSDVVALMGSTGRSTGPHVHFEVLLNGKTVDPAKYVNRVARF